MPFALGGEGAARNQAVQMHVLAQRLSPGVQHGGHAQLAAEAFGVGGKG